MSRRVVVVVALIGALLPLGGVVGAQAGTSRGILVEAPRPLDDPRAQSLAEFGGAQPEDPVTDTLSPACGTPAVTCGTVDPPPSTTVAPVPDVDGDGKQDVVAVTVERGRIDYTTTPVFEHQPREPVRNTLSLRRGTDGAVLASYTREGQGELRFGWREGRFGPDAAPGVGLFLYDTQSAIVVALTAKGVAWERRVDPVVAEGAPSTQPSALPAVTAFGDVVDGASTDVVVRFTSPDNLNGAFGTTTFDVMYLRGEDGASAGRVVKTLSGSAARFSLAGDLSGDGRDDFLVDRSRRDGPAEIAAMSSDGTVLWSRSYFSICSCSGSARLAGDVRGIGRPDVFVMTSYWTDDDITKNVALVDGRTGDLVWSRNAGFPEVLGRDPATGVALIGASRHRSGGTRDDSWWATGQSVVTQVLGGCTWYDRIGGDADGDGYLDFLHPVSCDDEATAYLLVSARTGARTRIPRVGSDLSAPVTPRTHDSAVLTRHEGTSALGVTVLEMPTAETVWHAEVPGEPHHPQGRPTSYSHVTAADLDGDGSAEVLVHVGRYAPTDRLYGEDTVHLVYESWVLGGRDGAIWWRT